MTVCVKVSVSDLIVFFYVFESVTNKNNFAIILVLTRNNQILIIWALT